MPCPNNTSTFSNRHSTFLSFPSLGFSPEFTSPSPDVIKAKGEQLFLQIIKIDLKIHPTLQNTQPASYILFHTPKQVTANEWGTYIVMHKHYHNNPLHKTITRSVCCNM
jgi:hypothetical protein